MSKKLFFALGPLVFDDINDWQHTEYEPRFEKEAPRLFALTAMLVKLYNTIDAKSSSKKVKTLSGDRRSKIT